MPYELLEGGRPSKVSPGPANAWIAEFGDGSKEQHGEGYPRFAFQIPSRRKLQWLLETDTFSAALAFVRGEFDIAGDLEAAIRFRGWQPRSGIRRRLLSLLARTVALAEGTLQTKASAARRIRFHYDRSNEFYRLFLDPRMIYSCAYFRSRGESLASAQLAKLDHVCRKLDLQQGDRLLDIGCGWGALAEHAAAAYGAVATGCTLSRAQFEYATSRLDDRAQILPCDYREVQGVYDKIASIGMFEHVGRRLAPAYFLKMSELLAPGGLMINHAIARLRGTFDDATSLFVRRRIFPGGELLCLDETIRAAERNGFEVLDVENLRVHYALTCRHWLQRLEANRQAALRYVDEQCFRAWRLWLAGSALSFDEGLCAIYQVLLGLRGSPPRRLTREHVYVSPSS